MERYIMLFRKAMQFYLENQVFNIVFTEFTRINVEKKAI